MTALPRSAREAFERGLMCYLAVSTPNGPHVTPVVFALDGRSLWITTARRSVKARAWRRDPRVAGLVSFGKVRVVFRGRVRTYDALDPLSWPMAAVAGPRLVRAATRFSIKNARFFAGYAVDARRIPLAWTPPGRVFAEIRLDAGRVVGDVEAARDSGWGEWPRGVAYRSSFAPAQRARRLDRWVPADVREAVGRRGDGALALENNGVLTVVPAAWRRVPAEASYEAAVDDAILSLACAAPESRAALTLDHASSWRAADMAGLMVQGAAEIFSRHRTGRGRRALEERLRFLDGARSAERALVRLRPESLVWWQGWRSDTVKTR